MKGENKPILPTIALNNLKIKEMNKIDKVLRRFILCILALMVVMSPTLQVFANSQVGSKESIENTLKQMEIKRADDLKSIWDQLVQQERTNHFDAHKIAYESEFNQIISAIKDERYTINEYGQILIMGDNNQLYWPNGGVLHYKSTPESFYMNVMEYYKPEDVTLAYWNWSTGNMITVSDYVGALAADIFFNLTPASFGFVALTFNQLEKIENIIAMNKFKTADQNSEGIRIHYYKGPFGDNSGTVLTWNTHPFVYPPDPYYNEYIRYYRQ